MADKRVVVYDTTLNVPDELTSVDRAEFPGGFVNAGAAGAMGAQKLTGLAAATATNDALAYGQSSAVLNGLSVNTQKLTGLLAGTVGTDAVNLTQLDAVAANLDFKEEVRVASIAALPAFVAAGGGVGKTLSASAVGILTVDGVATVLGDRILVKSESGTGANINNGIYEVTTEGTVAVAFILTRAADADGTPTNEVSQGMFVFVQAGSLANTGWVLATADPITVDTTALQFTKRSSITDLTAGAGLLDTANTWSVELDAAADAQGAGSGGGNSGLEFDAAGDGGQLRAKVDPAGGVQRNAAGLGLEIDATPNTLKVDATGLGVVGLPALFNVNNIAVGAAVTAANLDILSNGSNADALHVHATGVATEAPKVENTYVAQAIIAAGDPVHFAANNQVAPSNAASLTGVASQVAGVARTAAIATGNTEIVSSGPCAGVLVGAAFGDDFFLQNGTGLTTGAPTGVGKRRLWKLGYAINATDLFVDLQDLGIRTIP